MAIETPTLRDLLDRMIAEVESLRDRIAVLEALQPAKVIYNAPYNTQEECETHQCSYYTGYLMYGGPDLVHEGFHAAERAAGDHISNCKRDWSNGPCPTCQRHEQAVRA